MDKHQLKSLLRYLNLPDNEYVVFGGGCLTIRGLRKLEDLDLFISKRLYGSLARTGWQETFVEKGYPYLINTVQGHPIEAIATWWSKGWQPNIEQYLKEPEIVENIPFMPLSELYAWKDSARRPKDLKDLALIEAYWAKK